MSRASEWATSHPQFERGNWQDNRTANITARVDSCGWLTLSAGAAGLMNLTGRWEATPPMASISPEDALAFARWILDTFSDTDAKEQP